MADGMLKAFEKSPRSLFYPSCERHQQQPVVPASKEEKAEKRAETLKPTRVLEGRRQDCFDRLATHQAVPRLEQTAKYKKRRAPAERKPRIRLNQAQKARLELSYQRNPEWSNEEIDRLARLIQIPFTKVYKWNWERKKKD